MDVSDHDQRVLIAAMDALSLGVLRDKRHVQSNRTRLLRWYAGSGLPLDAFMALVREAHSRIIARQFELRRPAAYWFTTLAELISQATAGRSPAAPKDAVSPEPVRIREESKDAAIKQEVHR